jgi:hypothetical protein
MVVSVGDVAVGSANVTATSTWATYAFTFTATAGSQELRVTFDNDYYDATTGADRNLLVDKVSISCGTSGMSSSSSKPMSPIAFTKNSIFTLDSGTTNYVYVPTAYDSTHNTPATLFVWMHGCWGYADSDVGMVSPGGTQSWITLSVGGRDGDCWDVGNDSAKVLAAIADIKTHFNIKPKGVIVGGYSSGGELAYRTAFFNAGSFAGVLAENTAPFTSASPSASIAAASWKFNIVHLAHQQDDVFKIADVVADTDALKAAGFPLTLIEREGGHWDDSGALPGTKADLQTYLLPYLNAGWSAP